MANNSLLDALGNFGAGAMNILDMPGSYTRGALAGKFGERLSGSELLNTYTRPMGFETDDGIGTIAADIGLGMIDPLTVILPGAAALGAKGVKAIRNAGKLNYGKAKALRNQFTMVKGTGPPGLEFDGARVVGGVRTPTGALDKARLREIVESPGFNLSRHDPLDQGWYQPSKRLGSVAATADDPIGTARHEITHGLRSVASQTGQTSGLPLSWRVNANMLASKNPTIRGAGELMDEMLAQGVKGRGSWGFLNDPSQAYTDYFAQTSPLIAALYKHKAIPRAALGAAVAGGAGAGAGLGFGLASLLPEAEPE